MPMSDAGLSLPVVLMTAGVCLDWLLGEVTRWHPLVGFGQLAQALETRLNRSPGSVLRGALGWTLAVLPPVALAYGVTVWLSHGSPWLAAGWHVALLYFCLGLRSLHDHAIPILHALLTKDMDAARRLTARIVSRDTSRSEETDLAKAAVESLLENGNDAVFGTLFWFAVAGGPGALLFRLANTLDAMWGYRSPRFLAFGRVAARVDDVLNWIPARLTAWSYAMLGNRRQARACWRRQAPAWSSPNAGPVMSSGAGALGLILGGAATYDGQIELRPPLGAGRAAQAPDIRRAWTLVTRAVGLWLIVMLTLSVLDILVFAQRVTHA